MVAMWAALPMIAMLVMFQDVSSMMLLLATVAMAYVLRTTVSWELTLAIALVLAVVNALLIELFSPQVINGFVDALQTFLNDLQAEAVKQKQITEAEVQAFSRTQLHNMWFGFMASGYAIGTILFLVLARWWQSELYNPGGFGQEFKALRLSPVFAGGLAAAVVLVFVLGIEARWYLVCLVPLIVAASGFVHWFVAEKNLNGGWLVSFYLMFVLLNQLALPMAATLALFDSWFDLRNKIRSDREV